MRLCFKCGQRPRHPRESGGVHSYCLDCKRRRNRERARAKYIAERGDAYRPQVQKLPPLHVPAALRLALLEHAQALGLEGAR